MFKFYLPDGLNDATSFYVKMIEKALQSIGEEVEYVCNVSNISSDDKVLTITVKDFFVVWLRNRRQFIVNWWQGIMPEEIGLMFKGNWSKLLRQWFYVAFEKLCLKYAKKNIFVSNEMYRHYYKKYGYENGNYIVVPCFNQQLDLTSFTASKYECMSFVYAGSLSEWQCIDETLALYKKIRSKYDNATLTLLTGDIQKAKDKCQKYNVVADVYSVPLEALGLTLKKFKYGFIVRKDIAVNNVATPTKMNSYMAAGIIPVFSDVVSDFKENLSQLEYAVPFNDEEECLNKIDRIERIGVDLDRIKKEYENVFASHWSLDNQVHRIAEFLRKKKG